MSKFSISNLDLYYANGAFKALKNINLEIPDCCGAAFDCTSD